MGMESVNPQNLKVESKAQNKVEAYREIIREWHDAGIVVHAAYIIGLPWDTPEGVRRDLRFLTDELEPDQASFFMLTPLPGSHDHREMKKRGEWMDPDFNKRDSFHATIRHPRMTPEEWTEAYEDAWKTFYSKENMVRILARWNHNPKIYWNLMSIFFWYKNAALIEKQHPMIAGFFRLKDRKQRRPGFAVDALPVHAWKRAKEITRLFLAWARFLKEMEEVWLQTRKKSETEERWLAEVQNIQGEIWDTLKISELQKFYRNMQETLPARAQALLEPIEELSSKILFTRRDLNRFLRQWERLQARLDEVHHYLSREGESARRWFEEVRHGYSGVRSTGKIREWRRQYARLPASLPPNFRFLHVRFDALSNQVVFSRQDLQRFWSATRDQLRQKKFWNISPLAVATALIKDVCLTTSFAFRMKAHSRGHRAT
jgi:hypothetical protein